MIQIQYASDIHLEVNSGKPFRPSHLHRNTSVLVLAGDVTNSPQQLVNYLRAFPDSLPIVYVLGNHEYFGHDWSKAPDEYREVLRDLGNVVFLNNEIAVLSGIRFVGTTLWTDFLFGTQGPAAQAELPDYDHIKVGDRGLTWPDVYKSHVRDWEWLKEQILTPSNLTTVVVTHHAPSWKSNPYIFRDSPVTGAFCNKLDVWIEEHPVSAWIHGHTHSTVEYMIGETIVLANACGFFDENPDYRPQALIELETA